MTASGYRLREDELAALDDEAEAPAEATAGEPEPEPEPESEPEPEPADEPAADEPGPSGLELAGPPSRDLAYTVRLFDAALLAVDAAELVGDELSLADLLATRDRALDR